MGVILPILPYSDVDVKVSESEGKDQDLAIASG